VVVQTSPEGVPARASGGPFPVRTVGPGRDVRAMRSQWVVVLSLFLVCAIRLTSENS
jgi:hypothetical protein